MFAVENIANLAINSRFTKVFLAKIVKTLKYNRKLTQLPKFPSKQSKLITPKFQPANILHYTKTLLLIPALLRCPRIILVFFETLTKFENGIIRTF